MATKFAVKPRVKWLTQAETDNLADDLVADFTQEGADINELRELINDYAAGATLNGKQIYVKNLLGSMSSICPELVDAIKVDSTNKPKRKYRD